MILTKEIEFGGRTLKATIGKTARQADGAVWMQYGDTVLHVAAVSSRKRREGLDFLPLTVDYREKAYSAGMIPGGYFKREGRPHEGEILNSRMIDRPLRPLFPEGYTYETQVLAYVLSADRENDSSVLGPLGASLALNISDIPLNQPIASVQIGLIDGKFVLNPFLSDYGKSILDLTVVGSDEAIMMVEGHALQLSNQQLIDALSFGHEHIQQLISFQKEIIEEVGKPTREFEVNQRDEKFCAKIEKAAAEEIKAIARVIDKSERKNRTEALYDRLAAENEVVEPDQENAVKDVIHDMMKVEVRANILNDNYRIDGRDNVTIRDVECEVGLLPRAHGSALFTRGQTQALATATLGTKENEQRIDSITEDGFRKYMLHYNFPPFSTGEVKTYFSTSRREVGHGKLGERALEAALPDWDDFPYTIRVVSEILESNGSSSMATVCAGSLALMDAGVPMSKAVAGIAMGLIMEGDKYSILTDILGDEDHLGDMDFKVAGTRDGITAFQMDIKIGGISGDLMAKALEQARDARHTLLDIMDKTLAEPRKDVSQYAPKFIVVTIPVDRIGALIGPGGKMIREITSETGATIDIEDDGTVRIGASSTESAENARKRVEALTAVPEAGKIYNGTIKRITNFGAFVEIIPGIEGLMHISQIESYRIDRVEDLFKVGDEVKVKLLSITPDGKLDLSRKAVLYEGQDSRERPPPGDRDRNHSRPDRGGGYNRDSRRPPRDGDRNFSDRDKRDGRYKDDRPSGGGRPDNRDRKR